MSAIYVSEEALFSEAADIIRLFTGEKHFARLSAPEPAPDGRTYLVRSGDTASASVYEAGVQLSQARDSTVFLTLARSAERTRVRQRKHQAKRALYRALSQAEGRSFPWGSLTGIRPVKLFRELTEQYGAGAAVREFRDAYGVDRARVELSHTIYREQQALLDHTPEGVCVYIGVPFCPSRCRYCSFIAQDVAGARRVRGQYLEALLRELGAFAGSGLTAAAIYVGGGTPTTLSPAELEVLIGAARRTFPGAAELTLEAGRPDTITPEIMELAGALGVDRLSINPQTASDETLQRIGRAHTSDDFRRAMELPRPDGLTVNSDMILGLPGERTGDVRRTLDMILGCGADNVTVHALAVKKAADLAVSADWQMMAPPEAETCSQLVQEGLTHAGYRPYYLYRQKYMSGNLENIGFARPGTACRYNVLHMEELSSVLAFGAGGISKRIFPEGQRIERSANVKNAAQYVERLDEMIERKKRLFGLSE